MLGWPARDAPHATFVRPDLGSFCRLDELGLQFVGQRIVPTALREVITLGRTLKRRAVDVLASFDRPGTSNGPTEGDQRPPRTPPRLSPGFRNLTNYIARSLLETGGFRPRLHPRS
jgi:hypothetical protein